MKSLKVNFLKNKAVFLDRDGVLINEKNYLTKISEVEFITGSVEGVKMNSKSALIAVLVIGALFIFGCTGSAPSTYQSYNQPPQQGQPNGQYVGGGCGVAPSSDYNKVEVNPAQGL